MQEETFFGIAAVVAACLQYACVYRGVRRETTIDPTGWAIWAGLGVVLIATQGLEAGWQPALWISFVHLSGNAFVVYLGLSRGHCAARLKASDRAAIAMAAVGVTLSVVYQDASWGVWFAIAADCAGVWMVWRQAWWHAPSEPIAAWVLGTVAATAAFLSAWMSGKGILLPYPLYVIGNSFGSVLIIALRRVWLRRSAPATHQALTPATAGEVA